jgi:hypothetical protein
LISSAPATDEPPNFITTMSPFPAFMLAVRIVALWGRIGGAGGGAAKVEYAQRSGLRSRPSHVLLIDILD